MENTEPCSICGCTQTNLVDGYYYCAECGTQDKNVQETIVEHLFLGDGVGTLGSRSRITQIPQAQKEEMTTDWYKWHSLNFLLMGLAKELIDLGAAPTFKTKLLWVWTRYMNKYQNKADFGLDINENSDENEEKEDNKSNFSDIAFSSDEENEEIIQNQMKKVETKDIKRISMILIISFLYVALNLDKSHIQLTHLMRLMREGRVSIMQWQKLVPQELRPKKLRECLFFNHECFRYSYTTVRILSLEIFRKLDLGNPIVPDLRPLVDEYIQELCLPNDLKPLVISLIHYRSFDYLDVNVQYKELRRMPSYELHVMAHILMALKICFGFDSEYEVKMSNAVEKINEIEGHHKSYNSEPTKRLFSFREWCNYIQFRKTILRTHTLHLGAPNYFDMNDYVAFEHLSEKQDYEKTLKDEIAMDIIKKIQTNELNVIPKSEFAGTTTPHSSYTRVIIEHLQDPNVKQLLSEDFTQYSLKYILEDMFLVDPDSLNPQNILTGVSLCNIQEYYKEFDVVDPIHSFAKGMVYVKDCDNHNWTTTQRPQLEHISYSKIDGKCGENENYHENESDSNTFQNLTNVTQKSVIDPKEKSVIILNNDGNVQNDRKSETGNEMDIEKEEQGADAVIVNSSDTNFDCKNKSYGNIDKDIELLRIREETEGESIFDDVFVDLDIKKSYEDDPEYNNTEMPCELNESFNISDKFSYNRLTQHYRTDNDSDDSSEDSIRFNPDSLNRNEAIKELVIHACNKYKISIPGKYIHVSKNKRIPRKITSKNVGGIRLRGEKSLKINDLVSAYHSHIQQDIFYQMSNMVQSAIADFNQTKEESEMQVEAEDLSRDENLKEAANDQTIENEQNNTKQETEENETAVQDNQYNLFSDSSDGETYAEELLPKKNPEFDEATHDIRQLYIKPAEEPSIPKMKLNPKLFNIIDQEIETEKNNSHFLDSDATTEVKEKSDSEEDVCLSLLQEQKLIREQLSEQARRTKAKLIKQLIPNYIPSYKYWMRHYLHDIASLNQFNQRFANELDEKFPKSFVFVLKECADIVGYPPFNVYKSLQRIETCLKDKYVNRKRFGASYFEKDKRRHFKRSRYWEF